MPLEDKTRDILKTVSTATVCTALFKRGFRNQMIQGVLPLGNSGPMVGEAFTLRYMPAREDRSPVSVFQNPEHPQRKACLLYTSPSPRDRTRSRMPSSA